MKISAFSTYCLLASLTLCQSFSWAQGTVIDNGSPTNKWIFHNPEDDRKTLFVAPLYNGTWDFNQQTQFRPNGDVNFSGKVAIGTIQNTSAATQLDIYGNFRTTTGRFSSIYSANTDGAYPTNVINIPGEAQLSIGANWTGGRTDLSLINSNIGNTSGGGFSFWQMTGATSKKQLAYFAGNGRVGIGVQDPLEYAKLQIDGEGGVVSTGPGAHFRIRDQKSTRTTEPWLDEWVWYATDNVARFQRPGLGDVMTFNGTGNVGIGTNSPGTYKLAVEGKIGAREVEVKTGSWADFVFKNDYKLRPIEEVEKYIAAHSHLPEIPSEEKVKAEGVNLGEMNVKLLQKIEELTLYMIQQQHEISTMKNQITKLVEDNKKK